MIGALYVAIGSAIGGVARWTLGGWLQHRLGGEPPAIFPLGTLLVNASGSFVLGVLAVFLARDGGSEHGAMRLLLAVGFCGGYTTFSTFSLDTITLLESRGWAIAATNVAASVALGLAGALAGMFVGRAMLGHVA